MAQAHTPGPWVISCGDVRDAQQRLVAGIPSECAEAEANARLIAAAPDLLAALKLLARETELSGNHQARDYGWPKAYAAAIAAIAQAEGRT